MLPSCQRAAMSSATENPKVIEDYLTKEVAAGNIFGPFPPSFLTEVHINRFGAIPKRYQLGKWRLITDLLYPENASVNDAIDPSICSLTYTSVDEVAALEHCSQRTATNCSGSSDLGPPVAREAGDGTV